MSFYKHFFFLNLFSILTYIIFPFSAARIVHRGQTESTESKNQNLDDLMAGVQVFKDSQDLKEKMEKENLYFVIFLPDLQNTKLYTEYILTL